MALVRAEDWPPAASTLVEELYVTMWILTGIAVFHALWLLRQKRKSDCSNGSARLALFATALIFLFTVDRVAGILYPPPSASSLLVEPHPVRGWSLRRSAIGTESGSQTRTNSHGLRGSEVAVPKPAGERRVLVLGDSVAFGYGLTDDESFVTQIEKELRRGMPGTNVRCINAGVAGYATWQELHLLKEVGLGLEPDLIIVQFSFNDVTDVALFGPQRVAHRRIEFEFSNSVHWSGLVRAVLSEAARREWQRRKEAVPWGDPAEDVPLGERGHFIEVFGEGAPPIMASAWKQVFHDLDELVNAARAVSVPVVIMAFPPLTQMRSVDSMPRPQATLRAWAEPRQVPMLDLVPELLSASADNSIDVSALYLDEGHPNARGCQVIASSFARFAREHKLIPAASADSPP